MSDRAPRIETDDLGHAEVPAGVLWGVQTARSLRFFAIGTQRMLAPSTTETPADR